MFGRVEGSKQVFGDPVIMTGISKEVSGEELMFDFSTLGSGDEITITKSPAKVTPSGTDDPELLTQAPSSKIMVAGEEQVARIVVDLKNNYLYTYDENGNPQKAYLIASGKPKTPTDKGLRKISHFEEYPYKSAPKRTVRHKNPIAFGPRLMFLVPVDPQTGKSGDSNGEFIHGNNDPSSLGKYESGGCMRMDNDVVQELVDSGQIPTGSYVLIQ